MERSQFEYPRSEDKARYNQITNAGMITEQLKMEAPKLI